jgi:hypothetical protein
MKVAIMQPYFFPYIGYFSLISHVNMFILFDTVQFIRHGWIERNRILKPNEGWQYIRMPLRKHSRSTIIKDIIINNDHDWGGKIISQLQHYRKNAPFFNETICLLENAFKNKSSNIVEQNKILLTAVCDYLGIITPITIFSEMKLIVEKANSPDEWALNICKAIDGVTEYWNPPGGLNFFDRTKYTSRGIKINFQKVRLPFYDQKLEIFESGLSIIDVIMFNPIDKIRQMLDDYDLL